MTSDLHERIRHHILDNFLFTQDPSALGFEESLIGRGILDSTGILELVLYVEQQFGVKVRDEEMIPENFDSVGQLAAFVQSKLNVG